MRAFTLRSAERQVELQEVVPESNEHLPAATQVRSLSPGWIGLTIFVPLVFCFISAGVFRTILRTRTNSSTPNERKPEVEMIEETIEPANDWKPAEMDVKESKFFGTFLTQFQDQSRRRNLICIDCILGKFVFSLPFFFALKVTLLCFLPSLFCIPRIHIRAEKEIKAIARRANFE